MRGVRWISVAARAAAAGCGAGNLVLHVDVLSFLDPAATQASVGPLVAVPGGLYTGEQPMVDDKSISLLEGLSGAAEVRSVSIRVSTIAADSTGSGSDTLRLYLSDADPPPRSTPPVLTQAIDLRPGVTDTLELEFGAEPRVAALFTQRRMRMALTNSLRGPASGPDLNCTVRLRALDAVVIAGRKLP